MAQEEVEEILVTGLRAVDEDDVFGGVYDEVLVGCAAVPRDKKGCTSKLIELAVSIPMCLVEGLYDIELKDLCLKLIRVIIDLKEQYGEKHGYFFTSITECIYHSRRLFMVVITPQILDSFAEGREVNIYKYERVEENKDFGIRLNSRVQLRVVAVHKCYFRIGGDDYIAELKRKNGGLFFGSVLQIFRLGQVIPVKTYYIKAHCYYPALNMFDSNESYDIFKKHTSFESFSSSSIPIGYIKYGELILKELYIYLILSKLNYGPRTMILVNPYVITGVYIVTEDLNTENTDFQTENVMGENELIPLYNTGPTNLYWNIFSRLSTELSIISCLFQLKDFNPGNWGLVGPKGIFYKFEERDKLEVEPELMIVDSLPKNDSEVKPIKEEFFEGFIPAADNISNWTRQAYECRRTYLRTMRRSKNEYNSEVKRFEELYLQNVHEKSEVSREAVENFERHLGGRELGNVMREVLTELRQIIDTYSPITDANGNNRTNRDVMGLNNPPERFSGFVPVEEQILGLEDYIRDVVENYELLREYIYGGMEREAEEFVNENRKKFLESDNNKDTK